MYAEKRFDVDTTHRLDHFIDYLERNIDKTYVYANSIDCLNCRYHKAIGKHYQAPGVSYGFVPPSQEPLNLVIETIAQKATSYEDDGHGVGTYRAALDLAQKIRATDSWPFYD